MNLFKFFKIFLMVSFVFILASCTLEIRPPSIPYDSQTIESSVMRKSFIKPIINLKDRIAQQSNINKIESWEELRSLLKNNSFFESSSFANAQIQNTTQSKLNDADKDSGLDFSKINTWINGADEADIIKTDGRYIYALSATSIFIIDAYPDKNAKLLAEIQFREQPREFLISDNRLVVLGDSSLTEQDVVRESNYSYIKIFDTSDKSSPKELRHLDIEGDYVNSRLINDHLYFISSVSSFIYVREDSILPKILENNENVNCELANDCVVPDIYYFNVPYDSYNFVSINSINIQENQDATKSKFYILPSSQNIFLSSDNLYLSYAKYLSEYQFETEVMVDLLHTVLSDKNKNIIKSINFAESHILNEGEKQTKVRAVLEYQIDLMDTAEQEIFQQTLEQKILEKYSELSNELEKTVIHKINFDKGDVKYQDFGEVNGYIASKLSMNEKDGNLFIFTSKNHIWPNHLKNQNNVVHNIYALNNSLKEKGRLEGLIEGAQIDSVNFVEDRVYLKVIEENKPLLVIDISEAESLKTIGEIKIPDFFNYLHSYSNNIFIALGREIEENEQGAIAKGVKLSLLDTSNIHELGELGSQVLGGVDSDSVALYDHKTLLFSKNKDLLIVPVSIKNSEKGIFGNQDFDGVVLFNVSPQGFSLKGLVNHNDLTATTTDAISVSRPYHHGIKRSIFINDILYTFSDYGLKLSSLESLNTLGSFPFVSSPQNIQTDYIVNTY